MLFLAKIQYTLQDIYKKWTLQSKVHFYITQFTESLVLSLININVQLAAKAYKATCYNR